MTDELIERLRSVDPDFDPSHCKEAMELAANRIAALEREAGHWKAQAADMASDARMHRTKSTEWWEKFVAERHQREKAEAERDSLRAQFAALRQPAADLVELATEAVCSVDTKTTKDLTWQDTVDIAQAVLSAVTPAIREAVLEEAAKVCEAQRTDGGDAACMKAWNTACEECAAAIRAAKGATDEPTS